jgi:Ca2+/H+ antiporter, TMEM165/GDT1 family
MNFGVIAATFAVVAPAELPDKTFLAAITISARHRPLPVFWGVFLGLVVEAALGVVAGGLVALAPHRVVAGITAFGFFAGGAYLALTKEASAERAGEKISSQEDARVQRDDAARAARAQTSLRLALTTFVVVFFAEMGDLTQIVIVNLAARTRDALGVFIGAVSAFALTSALGVLVGRTITRVVPLATVRKLSAVLLCGLGVWSALSAAGI